MRAKFSGDYTGTVGYGHTSHSTDSNGKSRTRTYYNYYKVKGSVPPRNMDGLEDGRLQVYASHEYRRANLKFVRTSSHYE